MAMAIIFTMGSLSALAGGGGDDNAYGAQVAFVELEPLILPIIDNDGVHQIVSIIITLEAKDTLVADKVKLMKPKLQDAFIQDMYGMINRHAALKGGIIQVGTIKKRLNAISHKIMGEDQINDVLLQLVQQRNI